MPLFKEIGRFLRRPDSEAPKPDRELEPASNESLGIIDIRAKPKQPQAAKADEPVSAEREVREDISAEGAPENLLATSSSSHASKVRFATEFLAVKSTSERQDAPVMIPSLVALRAALEAHTVCILSRIEDSDRYRIFAIVSQSAYARSDGTFVARSPLIPEGLSGPTAVLPVGDDGFDQDNLGYYRDIIAVKEVALITIPFGSRGEWLLIADATHEPQLDLPAKRKVFQSFAATLASMLALRNGEQPGAYRPRREIIADEMERARSAGTTLALTLVYPVRAGAGISSDSEMKAAEDTFLERLSAAAGDFRIEKFGELLFGVFYAGETDLVEAWALQLREDLTEDDGVLEGGASVGVALLHDQHQDADDFRSDAVAALEESHLSGQCVISG